jgi:flap endonuclease-1
MNNMGVKNLSKIIKKFCPHVIKKTTLESYDSKVIGIDASIFFYKYLYVSNKYDKPNHYLQLFLTQIMNMLDHNIVPIYVFDGVAPKAKESEIVKRREVREKRTVDILSQKNKVTAMKQEILGHKAEGRDFSTLQQDVLEIERKIKSKEDTIIRVTPKHIANLKGLLTILSIPYLQGHGETDPLSAQLCKDGLFDYVMSEDMDYLPLATPGLLRSEMGDPGNFTKRGFFEYNYDELLLALNMTCAQFTDLCIMCGCDYVDQLSKIGPMTAYKLIKEHKTIEVVMKNVDHAKHKVPDDYMELVENARTCFTKKYSHRIERRMLHMHQPNIEKFQKFTRQFCMLHPYDYNRYMKILETKNKK